MSKTSTRLAVTLPAAQKALLATYAKQTGQSMANVLRVALAGMLAVSEVVQATEQAPQVEALTHEEIAAELDALLSELDTIDTSIEDLLASLDDLGVTCEVEAPVEIEAPVEVEVDWIDFAWKLGDELSTTLNANPFTSGSNKASLATPASQRIAEGASWTKLQKEDVWGVRITTAAGKVSPGQVFTVTRKDGTSSQETVQKVVWYDLTTGVYLCTVVAKPKATAWTQSWSPCGYPGCSPHYCDDCDGKGHGW